MPTPFQTEAWTEYAVGMVILLGRLSARTWKMGLRWQGDDYFSLLAILLFTAELVMLELIGRHGSITGMNNEIALALTPEQHDSIVFGSKCLLAGWMLYTTLIWSLKACMLFFYSRLTLKLRQHHLVKITAVICVLAYLATIIVYLTHCYPVRRLWQVYPYPGDECALNISKYLVLVVTNVTTDLLIFYIPIPLLWNVQMPIGRKILFGFWLCAGVFVIFATILRCVLSLENKTQINISTIWSIRETFVGIIAVNLPVLKPFLSQAKQAISSGSSRRDNMTSGRGVPLSHRHRTVRRSIYNPDPIKNSSEEEITRSPEGTINSEQYSTENDQDLSTYARSMQDGAGIQITHVYEVTYSSKSTDV